MYSVKVWLRLKASSSKFYGLGARCLINTSLLRVVNDALLVHLAPVESKDVLVVDDDCLDDLMDISLVRDLVTVGWNWQKRWSEADGQVIGVHHVLIRVLWQTRTTEVSNECKVQHTSSKVNSVTMHSHACILTSTTKLSHSAVISILYANFYLTNFCKLID